MTTKKKPTPTKKPKKPRLAGAKPSAAASKIEQIEQAIRQRSDKLERVSWLTRDPAGRPARAASGYFAFWKGGYTTFLGSSPKKALHFIETGTFIPCPTAAELRSARNPRVTR